MKYKDFCFFSLLSLITVFYFIEEDIWINPNGFIPRQRLAVGLSVRLAVGLAVGLAVRLAVGLVVGIAVGLAVRLVC